MLPKKIIKNMTNLTRRAKETFQMISGADAGGCHYCQCSTPKWLTLISRVDFSFLKILKDSQTCPKVIVGDTAARR